MRKLSAAAVLVVGGSLVLGPRAYALQGDESADWGSEASDDIGFGDPQGAGDADAVGFGQDGSAEADAVGFGDVAGEGPPSAEDAPPPAAPSPLSVTGFLRTRQALWTERLDDHPLAKARQSLDLELRYKERFGAFLLRLLGAVHAEYDLAYLVQRERFDGATLDAYEWQVIGGETFAALSYDAFELTVGRQIVALGQGELLSPLDVVNPRDQREPGLAELDDLRLAVLATRLGAFFGAHRLEAMVIHESNFGLLPAPLSHFSPIRPLLADATAALPIDTDALELHYEHLPGGRFDPENSQLVGRYSYKGAGIDLALYAASILDRQGVPQLPALADLERTQTPLRLLHPRYSLLGHAGALPQGDFLLRWELGVEIERPLAAREGDAGLFTLRSIERTQLLGMLGVTYSGIDDGTLGVEIAQSHVFGHPERDPASSLSLLAPVEQPLFAARYTHDFLRQTLQLTLVATVFGLTEYRGLLGRVELSYELVDALSLGGGYVTYLPHGGFGPIYGFENHDRAFVMLRWDFLLL